MIGRLLNGGGVDLVEAYEAEGQFTLCATLVKLLSTAWLVSHWDACAPTFERYQWITELILSLQNQLAIQSPRCTFLKRS